MAHELSFQDHLQAELYVMNIAIATLIGLLLQEQPRPKQAADALADMMSNTADALVICGMEETRVSAMKEVVRDRLLRLASAAANPENTPR